VPRWASNSHWARSGDDVAEITIGNRVKGEISKRILWHCDNRLNITKLGEKAGKPANNAGCLNNADNTCDGTGTDIKVRCKLYSPLTDPRVHIATIHINPVHANIACLENHETLPERQ
jgi:hypothetical protein